MATYALVRFTSPNAGVLVNQAATDQYIAAAYGQALKNLDVNALGLAIANTATSAFTLDASLASDTAGLKVPTKAGAAPTVDGFIAVDSTGHVLVFGSNGATVKALGNAIANALTAAGTLDMSLASDTAGLKLPSKAGAAPTADGFLAFDTTLHVPAFGLNGATAHPGLWMIADTLLGGSATNITFSSIPATYKHLYVVFSGRSDRAASAIDTLAFQLNGDTGANYNTQVLEAANGTVSGTATAAASNGLLTSMPAVSAAASVAGLAEITIPDYASTTLFKAILGKGGFADNTAANSDWRSYMDCWRSTAAVTSLKLFPNLGTNFVAGTRATLYGAV